MTVPVYFVSEPSMLANDFAWRKISHIQVGFPVHKRLCG